MPHAEPLFYPDKKKLFQATIIMEATRVDITRVDITVMDFVNKIYQVGPIGSDKNRQ